MARRRQQPGTADYYRRLATWPSLVAVCWEFLEPLTESVGYVERSVRLAAAATAAAASLGLAEAGAVGPADDRELVELLTGWRDVQVPQLMLDTRILGRALAAARAPER